jgi:hypothetical protein
LFLRASSDCHLAATAAQTGDGGVKPMRAQSSRSSVFRDFEALPMAGVPLSNSFVLNGLLLRLIKR